jgi:hypothetical protein
MASDADAVREVPRVRTCGAYRVGHDMHFIQARLSAEDGPGVPRTIASIADDGTIVCTDGTRLWNHDPVRLRTIIGIWGPDVMVGTRGVLRVPNGDGAYCISVSDEPDPCRPETAEVRAGESVVDELRRRGGLLLRVADLRAELESSP